MLAFSGMVFNLLNQQQQPQPNPIISLIPFVAIFAIFYFLLIVPAKRKQKKHQEMVESLKPGDQVVTSGGIYGTIMGVKPDRFELKIASNVKIEISKNAIAGVLNKKEL